MLWGGHGRDDEYAVDDDARDAEVVFQHERDGEGEQDGVDDRLVEGVADARQRAHEAGLDRGDRLARDAAVLGALFLHRHADAHDDDADVGLGVEELLMPLERLAQVLLGGVEFGEDVADRVGEAEALKPLVVDAAVGKNEPLKPGVKQVLFSDDRLDDAGFLLCHLSHLRFLHVVEEIERRRRDREGRHAHHRHAQVGHEEKAHEEIGRHALFHDHLEVERDADRREPRRR